MKYFKFPSTIYKLTSLAMIMIILVIAINSGMYGRISTEGWGLIFAISFVIAFNNNLRELFQVQEPILKAIILVSIFWIFISTTFLMIFLDYDNIDFFGRRAMDGIGVILFTPLFLLIGRQFYTIYVNSLKAKDE